MSGSLLIYPKLHNGIHHEMFKHPLFSYIYIIVLVIQYTRSFAIKPLDNFHLSSSVCFMKLAIIDHIIRYIKVVKQQEFAGIKSFSRVSSSNAVVSLDCRNSQLHLNSQNIFFQLNYKRHDTSLSLSQILLGWHLIVLTKT